MSTDVRTDSANRARARSSDLKIEVVTIPVSDIDRAKEFYGETLGWRLDADFTEGDKRVVQFTPPGSPASIHFGAGRTSATPGSAQGMFLVVSDINAARDGFLERGVEVGEIFHPEGSPLGDPAPGPAPDHASYGSYAAFGDPDGNTWLLQEVTTRLPGRGFNSDVPTLTELLRETEKRHGGYESTAPKHHWSDWYAAYMVARQRGRTSDDAAKEAALHLERTQA